MGIIWGSYFIIPYKEPVSHAVRNIRLYREPKVSYGEGFGVSGFEDRKGLYGVYISITTSINTHICIYSVYIVLIRRVRLLLHTCWVQDYACRVQIMQNHLHKEMELEMEIGVI